MKPEYDVIIVGGGPAGLSAALLLGRCLRRVMVCDAGHPRNAPSRAMHGFLGQDGVNPAEFLAEARKQLDLYGTVKFTGGIADRVELSERVFSIHCEGHVFRSRALLLATGVRDALPDVPSAKDYLGITLHSCPYCDGWEHRGQNIGVLGCNQEALDLSLELLLWSSAIRLYTNSETPLDQKARCGLTAKGIELIEGLVEGLHGKNSRLSHVTVKGVRIPCEALFFSPQQTHQSGLAQSLGCPVVDSTGAVECGLRGETKIEGLFVAGNVSKGIQLAIVAAAEGVNAAASINDWMICADTKS